jgi:dATP pyrophosphohydrolase
VPTRRRPLSVLVVVHSDDGKVLLLKRTRPFEFWQSVTGSLDVGESHSDAACRELLEETGLADQGSLRYTGVSRQFVIDPRWRYRFEPGIIENVEFEWRYRLPEPIDIRVDGNEHSEYRWLPIADAIGTVWSWTNRQALRNLELR